MLRGREFRGLNNGIQTSMVSAKKKAITLNNVVTAKYMVFFSEHAMPNH
jgi:hypothetical protein